MPIDQLLLTRMEKLTPIHKKFGEYDEFESFPIIPKNRAGKCSVYFYRLPPGKANFPYHYHEGNEEVFYIISGQGIVLTSEGEKNIIAGDVIVCPPTPGGAHKIANISATEPLVYIEFDTVNDPEIIHYPHTNTVGIIRSGVDRNEFFQKGVPADYEHEVETPEKDW